MTDSAIEPLVPNAWYIAAWPHELGREPLGRRILDEDIVIFRDAHGRVSALEDRCCHRGAPLTRGALVSGGLQCGYHGMVFGGDGVCVSNPGESGDPARFRVRAYPIIERQGFIWIWMGSPSLADEREIIDFPYHDRKDEWKFRFGSYHIEANYMFLMDNLMDLTHLAYVHTTTIGGSPDAHATAQMETTRTATGVHFLRWMLNSPPPPTFVQAAGFKGRVDRWSDFEYVAPSSVIQWGGALDVGRGAQDNRNQDGGVSLRLFHHATPETLTTCHYFWSVAARNVGSDSQVADALYRDIWSAFLEDKAMIEAQQAIILKDPTRKLSVRKQDKALSMARHAVRKLRDRPVPLAAE